MADVFIESLVVGSWQTNCYLVGATNSSEVVVIDPGMQAAEPVRAVLKDRGWRLSGVIATHGHVDHIADAATLANAAGVPLWLHSGDDYMLTNPLAGISAESQAVVAAMYPRGLEAPAQRRDLAGLDVVDVAGLSLAVSAAPGHTPGCVLLGAESVVWCGDVVFAGSVGRTDLPGGDPQTMRDTLRDVVLRLDDSTRLLPGHGPATSMYQERRTNPYLQPGSL